MSNEKNLPESWASSTIGEICEPSQYGYTAKAGGSGNTHFLRTTDITSGPINWTTVPWCFVTNNELEKYRLRDGDVVISRTGSVGFSCLIRNPEPSVFASYLIRFRPLLNAKYFSYFLQTPSYWTAIDEQSLGIAVQNVNASRLSEIPLPIAPCAEQTRIVEKLEELLSDLDAGVAELKAAQAKLAQYRQSLLKAALAGALTADWRAARQSVRPEPVEGRPSSTHASTSSARTDKGETGAALLARILSERRARWEARQLAKYAEQGKTPPKGWQTKYPEPVAPDTSDLPTLPEGWVWASVDQVSFVVRGASPRPAGDPRYFGGDIPWITVGSITADDSMYLDSVDQFVTLAGKDASRYIEPNTLLLTNSGATLGVPKITRIGGCINDGSVALLDVDGQLEIYLYWFLRTQTRRLRALNQGAAQPNLNTDIVKRICVPLPRWLELCEINGLLDKAMQAVLEQISSIEHDLAQAAAQRKNLLKAAFAGQLVPQDPADEPASALLARIRAERVAEGTISGKRGRKKKKDAP